MAKIFFTPDIELDIEEAPTNLTIKGQSPRLTYPVQLRDIYPTIPPLDAKASYQKIRNEFQRVNHILANQFELRPRVYLPPATDQDEAISILSILFDPNTYWTQGLWRKLSGQIAEKKELFRLDDPQPFPLQLASPQKLIHTLVWIDTNIKIAVESILLPLHLPAEAIAEIVESALKCYCYLVKQQDFLLARSINFNFSMFLQDRILNLLLGDELYLATYQLQDRGRLANEITMQLLKSIYKPSYRQLCTLSVFMGVIWVSSEETQRAFRSQPDLTLGQIETWINSQQKNWGVDNIDAFVTDISLEKPVHIVVILDDNGESVFDIAICQQALDDFGLLHVTFVVNRYPVSNNIALHTFESLLREDYFERLRNYFSTGRAALCIENQVFRSFEVSYLQQITRQAIDHADLVYVKGLNFFETFQLPEANRYHCFTVHGKTGTLLTGFEEGKGIFVRLSTGEMPYTYHAYNQVATLRDKLLQKG
jgi:hypothetical protein